MRTLMDSKSKYRGKSPGAAGAHHPSVFVRNVSKHIGDVGKGSATIGATVNAGGVKVEFGFGRK